MSRSDLTQLHGLYGATLARMVDTDTLKTTPPRDPISVLWDNETGTGIAYHYRPDLNAILLVEPVRRGYPESQHQSFADRLSTARSRTDISRLALRSYPLYITLDLDAWTAIQNDKESNLALSPEEAQIIDSIRARRDGTKSDFPLFINGLAGSGKSTILQYIAAMYIDFSLRQRTDRLPLYLTASADLLRRARRTIRDLITTNHERLLDRKLDASEVGRLDECFRTFRELRSLLPPTDLHQHFRNDRYVNYALFRRLWETDFARRPKARQLSVEVSWHVIRAFIKGVRADPKDDLSPEDFDDLPRRSRESVRPETYTDIYENVWAGWYKPLCNNDGYWDDQDLAAHMLSTGIASKHERAAIFCDEAQDFTSTDLDVIFQLSLFGRRSLQPYELRRVPIIFAGDPLQTINPTGFRWDAVKADFHERFRATLDTGGRSKIELRKEELHFNYRSNGGIVRFCNLLQLARTALLERADIHPQDYYWTYQRNAPPTWFSISNPATESHMRDHPEFIKLVNCHEGGEKEYVEEDPILRKIVDRSEEGTYRNVMSPTRAKGLEFATVVLYRFGDDLPGDFGRLFAGKVDLNDPHARLPWEYFFNRLYVAASRARDRLIIVDSETAINGFWKVAADPDIEHDLIAKIEKDATLWKGRCAQMLNGTPEAWDEVRFVDQRAQADRFAEQGRIDQDSYLLRQAGLSYRSANDDYRAIMCFSEAKEMDEDWEGAGDMYSEAEEHEHAYRCYWAGRLWRHIKRIATAQSHFVTRVQSRAADFMLTGKLPKQLVERLIVKVNDMDQLRNIGEDPTWRSVLRNVLDRVADAPDNMGFSPKSLFEAFERVANAGVPVPRKSIATLAYRARDFAKAVELWEADGDIQSAEYLRSKAHIAAFPECFEFLSRLRDHGEILRRWKDEHPSDSVMRKLTDNIAHVVADAAIDQGDFTLVVTIMQAHPDGVLLGRLLKAATEESLDDIVCDGAVETARLFVRNRQWNDVVEAERLDSIGKLADVPSAALRASLSRQKSDGAVLRTLVFELANSTGLVSDAPTIVASFLQQRFIGGRGDRTGPTENDISVEVIGAAIERSGKIVNALQYYEDLLKDEHVTRDIKAFAAGRLVCNLHRHATYLEGRGNHLDAQQQKTRADQLRRKWGIDDGDLPEFPEVRRSREEQSKVMIGDASREPFWYSPSLDELERMQNVEPVADIKDLYGTWPGDDDDGFEDAIEALRHPGAEQSGP